MPTAVFFDLDGTVVEFTRDYTAVIEDTLTDHFGSAPEELVETYNEAFYERFMAVEPEPVLGAMKVVCEHAEEPADPEALRETLHGYELAMTHVSDDARALFETLGDRHHLGVLTNGVPEWQRSKLEHHELLPLFDTVVTSYEAEAHKPDPAVFELARERAPDDIDQFVMVGDDYEPDVQGAREAGFRAVHLDRGSEGARVANLGELGSLLSLLG
ncbi:HAD family hydrolase [Haloarchaeobius sp. HME9146]|uniref:HAD family hydrolase n=1 Tax=Haloarchaeobius sp. HME9146 TaxID=2978732 RepID=UPI0021C11682|nr:HAD family hydrolase [Haloarchaeobius sp. HME9146]MCT9094952.1 HAD family hydrolase [Haloarchaeobius sp. HME9146]